MGLRDAHLSDLWLAVTVSLRPAWRPGLRPQPLPMEFWKARGGPLHMGLLTFSFSSFLAVLVFEVIFSHRQEGGLFDRIYWPQRCPPCSSRARRGSWADRAGSVSLRRERTA